MILVAYVFQLPLSSLQYGIVLCKMDFLVAVYNLLVYT